MVPTFVSTCRPSFNLKAECFRTRYDLEKCLYLSKLLYTFPLNIHIIKNLLSSSNCTLLWRMLILTFVYSFSFNNHTINTLNSCNYQMMHRQQMMTDRQKYSFGLGYCIIGCRIECFWVTDTVIFDQ